jgi:hypothetical protein
MAPCAITSVPLRTGHQLDGSAMAGSSTMLPVTHHTPNRHSCANHFQGIDEFYANIAQDRNIAALFNEDIFSPVNT